MSRRFTLVPSDILEATQDFLAHVARDPAVVIDVDAETCVYFAGSPEVAKAAPKGEGLACLRVLGSGVFHVDTDGYEASVVHLAHYVGPMLRAYQCKVFDDESGKDLTYEARERPDMLFEADPGFQ